MNLVLWYVCSQDANAAVDCRQTELDALRLTDQHSADHRRLLAAHQSGMPMSSQQGQKSLVNEQTAGIVSFRYSHSRIRHPILDLSLLRCHETAQASQVIPAFHWSGTIQESPHHLHCQPGRFLTTLMTTLGLKSVLSLLLLGQLASASRAAGLVPAAPGEYVDPPVWPKQFHATFFQTVPGPKLSLLDLW